MTVEYIRYTVADPARGAELVSAYEIARRPLDAAPECLGYELSVVKYPHLPFPHGHGSEALSEP